MAGGMDLGTGGKGKKKPLDTAINLVPFIDLMAVTISFLIMTAVWNQINRLTVSQSGGPNENPAPPDTKTLPLNLIVSEKGFTISSGGSGGVFGPSMLIGGMLGGACGQFFEYWLPGFHVEPAAFVLVGMGGFFAGVSKTPLTSIVMVSEMTGSYSLLVPLMLGCGLNMAISRRWTIYEEQVSTPIDSPAHQGDFVVDVLEQLSVSAVGIRSEGLVTIPASMPFRELAHLVAQSTETLFPVIDGHGRLTGIFTLHDLRLALVGSEWGPLVLADDLAYRPVLSVTPEDNLHTALRRMTEINTDEIPVVESDDPTHLLGLLSRRDLTLAYTSLIESLRSNGPSASKPGRAEEAVRAS
jgi:chloride channel protein, CIC family